MKNVFYHESMCKAICLKKHTKAICKLVQRYILCIFPPCKISLDIWLMVATDPRKGHSGLIVLQDFITFWRNLTGRSNKRPSGLYSPLPGHRSLEHRGTGGTDPMAFFPPTADWEQACPSRPWRQCSDPPKPSSPAHIPCHRVLLSSHSSCSPNFASE